MFRVKLCDFFLERYKLLIGRIQQFEMQFRFKECSLFMLCMKIKQQAGYFLQQGYRDRTVIYSVYRSAAREPSPRCGRSPSADRAGAP